MDLKTNIKIINNIEDNIDVNELKYRNLNIWPIIRHAIWKQLLHPKNDHLGMGYIGRKLDTIYKKIKYLMDLFFYIIFNIKNIINDLINEKRFRLLCL